MGKFLKRQTGLYIVIYDITSDKERRKVDKLLKSFGFRVQKSVFECKLMKRNKEKLIEKLKELEIETGFIKIYKEEYCFNEQIIGVNKQDEIDGDNAFLF